MDIEVIRDIETSKSISGKMSIDGVFECFTLEPSRNTPFYPGHPCIAAGTFDVDIRHSPGLGYDTPEILNVPDRTWILIHIANYPKDLKGCTGVGQTRSQDFIGLSKAAFEILMPKIIAAIGRGERVQITYVDPVVAV